ncbi:MAG: hypothetical protein KFB94_00780 [Methylophilaceae bacterium]|nr:MAG: hypothetical protein KFB94_00780 [Methylophilaceae bacterium]
MYSTVDFKEHLKKQLGFLDRSCQSYDAGFTDEAVRIATVIRVLIHQTRESTSLLEHLNATTINFLSTTFEPSAQTVSFVGMGMMRVGGGESEYFPQLGEGPINEFIPFSKWWNQVVMVLDAKHRITRKNIVLAAANKDGGAHVDKKLTAEYVALAAAGAVGTFIYESQGQRDETEIEGAHLVSLRQMGYELLHSPMLVALCNG